MARSSKKEKKTLPSLPVSVLADLLPYFAILSGLPSDRERAGYELWVQGGDW
jgi:hypothetical protein